MGGVVDLDSVLVKTGLCLVRLSLLAALPLPLSMSDRLGLSSDLPIDWKLINSFCCCWPSSLSDFGTFSAVFFTGCAGLGAQDWSLPDGSLLKRMVDCWREATGHGGIGGATLPPLPEEDQ